MLRKSFGMVVACGFLAGCVAAPLGALDGAEAPLLQAATKVPYAPGTAGRLCGIYLGEPRGAVDVGLLLVFPGREDMDQDDPDSPRYNEVWDRSIGLSAHARGAIGMAADFQYYAGLTLAFMKGKDYYYAPYTTDISLSDEMLITFSGGVQYRKDLKKIAPYGRLGVGLLFWPETELKTGIGDTDVFDSSMEFIFEMGGGMAFTVGMGRMYFDIGFTFGPEPDLASGFSGDVGKYNTFTMTIGGALKL